MKRIPSNTIRLGTLLLAVGLVACNGDETAAPTVDTAREDTDVVADEAFCDAAIELGSPGEPEVDFETATEAEVAAAQQVFAEERLRPLVTELGATGPEEIQGDVATLDRVLDDAAENGELEAFFQGEGGDARNAIAAEAADRCGWESLEVTAVDYDFEGVPETLDAGQTVFSFTNHGDEGHEMILFRRKDGVEEGWEAILELDEEESMQRVDFVTAAFAPSGEAASAAAELSPGEYAMVCFIPVGTDASGEQVGDGPPHFQEGMLATFEVVSPAP